ncbi:MAG: 4-hydroxythreonine-4-phosphate dehydrogenase PdxA [Legionellales bacterium RIFCSPHIGHO2_12_FULL_37_14]|nr:MAG: 4-hydroxythreonine-4-phosphate dehydrogenase PdxA [Legionellales bacterium RIFCSPHIGHO2_12_FULL_37_14]
MQPIIVTSGEPAGIGPEICLQLAFLKDIPVVVLGDYDLLSQHAKNLKLNINLKHYSKDNRLTAIPNTLWVWHIPLRTKVNMGVLDVNNSHYVLDLINKGALAVKDKTFSAMVTAPIHKGIINDAGISFKGHTEYLANFCNIDESKVVMLLASAAMKVALVTTHVPLAKVASFINKEKLTHTIEEVYNSLQSRFKIAFPRIIVTGLNPHAGEGGHMGREEIDIISPVIKKLQEKGLNVKGPFAADTIFTPHMLKEADAVVAMYHDQGLPVLKYTGFGDAVNVTLGLPIIRTSVDHGTALPLAGKGEASASSLIAAVKLAEELSQNV